MQSLILVLILIQPALSTATEQCKAEYKPWGDAHGLFQLTFPDGREFQIIGHNHGASRKKADLIAAVSDESTTNEVYLAKINHLLQDSAEALRQADKDLTFLRTRLGKDDGAMLAIEANEMAARLRVGLTEWLLQKLDAQFTRRGLSQSQLRRSITLMSGGVPAYLAINEPGLIRKHAIVGVDDGIVEDMPEIWGRINASTAQLKVTVSPELMKTLLETEYDLSTGYYELEGHTDADLIDRGLRDVPAAHKPLVEQWLHAQLQAARNTSARDRHIVGEMLKSKKSAVLLIGHNHLRSLEDKLLKECGLPKSADAPTERKDPAAGAAY